MFDRIKNLMGAMVNSGVNKLETPEVLLEQAETELQANSKKLKEALIQSVASEKLLEKQLQKAQEEFSTWEKRATVAVQAGNDQVATDCLKKKQEAAQTGQSLQSQMEQQKVTTAALKTSYAEIETKLADFLRRKPEMLARAKNSDTLAKANELVSGGTAGGGQSMDKWEQKIQAKELQIDPLGTGAVDQKFKALDQHNELDDELAALKAKMGVPNASAEHTPTLIEVIPPKEDSEGEKK